MALTSRYLIVPGGTDIENDFPLARLQSEAFFPKFLPFKHNQKFMVIKGQTRKDLLQVFFL